MLPRRPSPVLSPKVVAVREVPCHKPYIKQGRSSRRCLHAYRVQQRTLPFSLPERIRVSVCRVYCPRMPTHAESPGVQEWSPPISDGVAESQPLKDIHLESRRTTRLRCGVDGGGTAFFLVAMLHHEEPALAVLCGNFESGRPCGNWTNFSKPVLARRYESPARWCFDSG